MPTIIDSLVVELGLDPSQLDKGVRQAGDAWVRSRADAQRYAKDTEQSATKMLDSFRGLQGRLLGLAALFLGGVGLKNFATDIVRTTSSMGYLAGQIRSTVQELQSWEYLGRQMGASDDEFRSFLKNFENAIADFQVSGTGAIGPALSGLRDSSRPGVLGEGIKLTDEMGRRKTKTEVLIEMSRWAARQPDKALAAAGLRQIPGMTQGVINAILQGPDYIRRRIAEAEKIAPSKEDAEKLQALQTAWARMTQQSQALARTILVGLVDPIKKVFEVVQDVADFYYRVFKGQVPPGEESRQSELMKPPLYNFYRKFLGAGDDKSAAPGAAPSPAPAPAPPAPRTDVPGAQPASIRYNNPGAQYPSREAAKFGMTGYGIIGGGHEIAKFPTPEQGAAANMELLSRKYAGMRIGPAGMMWTGSLSYGVPGFDPTQVITPEMTRDPKFMLPFMKSIARREAGRPSPMTDEQWMRAFEMYRAGGFENWQKSRENPQMQGVSPWTGGAPSIPWISLSHPSVVSLPGRTISSSVENRKVNIGELTLQTQSSDPYGLHRALPGQLQNNQLMSQSNYGQN